MRFKRISSKTITHNKNKKAEISTCLGFMLIFNLVTLVYTKKFVI